MNNQTLSIGYSTCPNDTFVFDALINGKIDTQGYTFDPILTDVEELNVKSFDESLDITKLSIFAYSQVADKYQILDAGSALGTKNGPLLISKKKINVYQLEKYKIAIPGKYTTANFLLTALFPNITDTVEMVFSDIIPAMERGDVDAGVIIHETRFTYQQLGYSKILDLGQRWERKTGLPIPLGCIAIRRSLPDEVKTHINILIRKSIEQAFINPEGALPYCKKYAQEMSNEIMLQHIILYVNNFSLSLGDDGREAITTLYEYAHQLGLLENEPKNIFCVQAEHN